MYYCIALCIRHSTELNKPLDGYEELSEQPIANNAIKLKIKQ
jgi:hypothetical protein